MQRILRHFITQIIFYFIESDTPMVKYISFCLFLSIGNLNGAALKTYCKGAYDKATVDERVNAHWQTLSADTSVWWSGNFNGPVVDNLIKEIGTLNAQMVFISLKEKSNAQLNAQQEAATSAQAATTSQSEAGTASSSTANS